MTGLIKTNSSPTSFPHFALPALPPFPLSGLLSEKVSVLCQKWEKLSGLTTSLSCHLFLESSLCHVKSTNIESQSYAFPPVNLPLVSLIPRPQLQSIRRVGFWVFFSPLHHERQTFHGQQPSRGRYENPGLCITTAGSTQPKRATTNPELPHHARLPPPTPKALPDLLGVDLQTPSTPQQQDPIPSVCKA